MSALKLQIEKGKITLGRDKFISTLQNLPDGEYIWTYHVVSPRNEEEWRRYYFLLRDILYEDGETGYTKKELHDMAKAMLGVTTTSSFSKEQWQQYVKDFKEWAFESFNCYL